MHLIIGNSSCVCVLINQQTIYQPEPFCIKRFRPQLAITETAGSSRLMFVVKTRFITLIGDVMGRQGRNKAAQSCIIYFSSSDLKKNNLIVA